MPDELSVYEKLFETSDIMSGVLKLFAGHFLILLDIFFFYVMIIDLVVQIATSHR